VAWGVRKLHQLLDCSEPRGDFLAQVPGSEKSTSYPSTVAYVADLILHRLKVLGLVDARGEPKHEAAAVIDFDAARFERTETHGASTPRGLLCEACGGYTARVSEGCLTCPCGHSKCG